MKGELHIDNAQIAAEITQELIKALKPLLSVKAVSEDAIFSVDDLADYLRVSVKWVYCHTHVLPHFKLGGMLRFRKKDIDQVIDKLALKEKLNKVTTI